MVSLVASGLCHAALVLLLAVVGYQNLVTYPRMKQALDHPQVLPWVSVNVGTFGGDRAGDYDGAREGIPGVRENSAPERLLAVYGGLVQPGGES